MSSAGRTSSLATTATTPAMSPLTSAGRSPCPGRRWRAVSGRLATQTAGSLWSSRYGNFDITMVHFSRIYQRFATRRATPIHACTSPHAARAMCRVLYLVPGSWIGASDVVLKIIIMFPSSVDQVGGPTMALTPGATRCGNFDIIIFGPFLSPTPNLTRRVVYFGPSLDADSCMRPTALF